MSPVRRVLITGANGFVGRHLGERLAREGWQVLGAVRRVGLDGALARGVETVRAPDLADAGDWTELLRGLCVDFVVHLASLDHFVGDGASDGLADFRGVNVVGTKRVATACLAAGVKRFLFLSSIKAVGEGGEAPYTEQSQCRPQTPYGVSKLEAESMLRQLSPPGSMEVVILRPPLVYGPEVGKSFLRLIQMVRRGLPLPLALVRNERSFVYVGNLVDGIATCLRHPAAANELFHVADAKPMSTPELLRRLAGHLGCRSRLLPAPVWALRSAGRLMGKREEAERLLGSLTVSAGKMREDLGWEPPFSEAAGLAATCDWFLRRSLAERR